MRDAAGVRATVRGAPIHFLPFGRIIVLDRLQAVFAAPEVRFLTLIAAAVVAGYLIHVLLRLVLRRSLRGHDAARAIARRVEAPARVLLPLLAISVVLEHAQLERGWLAGVEHLVSIASVVLFTWLALRIVGGIETAIASHNLIDVADNLHARTILTQTRVLSRTAMVLIGIIGAAAVLMTFPGARQIGTSLLASAGLAGLVAGFAARQVLGNLLAGVQIALTQPIRIDDVLIVEGEWGRVEEIAASYVVVRIWDERRLVVPLEYFISKPFQNWTRTSAELIGSVFVWVDYALPVEPLRRELTRLCESAKQWDRRVCNLQVTDANEHAMQLRAIVSSSDASANWDLRCLVREGLIAYIAREHPDALPRVRAELDAPREETTARPRSG
jgi:small-conductance mechanosensitive channel